MYVVRVCFASCAVLKGLAMYRHQWWIKDLLIHNFTSFVIIIIMISVELAHNFTSFMHNMNSVCLVASSVLYIYNYNKQ